MEALVAHLRAKNVRVWTYGGAKPDDPGVPVRFITHRRLGTLWALFAEGRNARILDASHFHLEYPNAVLLPVWLLLKRLLGFEWYKNVHDGSLPRRFPTFSPRQRRLFYSGVKAVDHFVVVSEDLKRWLRDDINVRQPITVIPGLLPNSRDARDGRVSSRTEELIKPYMAHRKRVCSIGVFFPSYGFNDVAKAVEQLRAQTKEDIGLILVDGGFVRDEQYRSETLHGRNWITVLEEVPNPELYGILKRSDVFVRAFADESYGIARIEAIWSGLPVVATRAGETRGMLLYDFGNEEELIGQLNTALFNPASTDIAVWADRYRREAEENLQALMKLLRVAH
jgi:glycosyltransferase involved in cell wall biosynthesis